MKSVVVYCGSNAGAKPEYRAAAEQFGQELAARNITLVYGGGNVGMMGFVADAVLQAGGHVIGVIPESLAEIELAHSGVSDMRVVASMHERKALMVDLSDAFVALPGGFGTFDELCEVATWCQLGIEENPIGILNVAGYFDPMLQQFDKAVQEGFLKQEHRDLILADANVASLLDRMQAYQRPNVQKWINRDDRQRESWQQIGEVTLVVDGYDRAIEYYVDVLGFRLLEDTRIDEQKRWVRVGPGSAGTSLLLARATTAGQTASIGHQAGGRVFLFLHTSNFKSDYESMASKGVRFLEEPRDEAYGRVVVFEDLFGNKWDLIEAR